MAVVGARPNFVKLAPLVEAARRLGRGLLWVHTGQHRDQRLTRALWRDLGLPPPAAVTPHEPPGLHRAERMAARLLGPLASLRPSLVVVVGDVDSTVAGALAARGLGLPLAHVEAGLRCGDRRMPEERNRVRVDRLSALLHVSEPSGLAHLAAEGIPGGRVHRAGNVMADAVRLFLPRARALDVARTAGRRPRSFGVVTLHRPANVDDPARLARFACALGDLARELPLVFPVHPRTQRTLGAAQRRRLARAGVRLMPPLGYLDFLSLLDASALALTDSGGVPVEASLLRVPCVTLRARYEHVLTLTHGTNRLAGGDPRRLVAAARAALGAPRVTHALPEAWDGRAAPRIVARWTAEAPPGST